MENKKNHILIVDDDNRIRDLLKDFLYENGYIVSTAENAVEAKEKLKYLNFQMLILDVMMPGQNGYEQLIADKRIKDFRVICSHQESLHSHDAISVILHPDSKFCGDVSHETWSSLIHIS